ncbi:hypothetical protein PAAG_11173 [Paracoccidioides lutzii Pb01]|uniref:Uncharacterized protein n=1 Tax=Paracoccidioides lutzii (strain ATCC MYA-826 / Pb01) TaxID=502779 RepID=A0A0A2V7A8_PARBA|nr:hypothetical protein PAAG_11173 [Paracoccidioides lutzii Pb01]KGQ02000.1 hypothetical protein PAAG_11173 [Paracoccidioides lutzii Pb01]
MLLWRIAPYGLSGESKSKIHHAAKPMMSFGRNLPPIISASTSISNGPRDQDHQVLPYFAEA